MINFFNEDCIEEILVFFFGLCDEESGRLVYIDIEN